MEAAQYTAIDQHDATKSESSFFQDEEETALWVPEEYKMRLMR